MVKDRRTLVLYTTAVCNLRCVYCFIDKNPALVKIDNILDESFKGDYYYNFTKKMFPDPNQLREVQIWGGEPTLRLDRCYYTIERLIDHYPKFNRMMMSTNFTGKNWFDQFYGLMDVLGKANRKFTFSLQLSIDGPKEITDAQRGAGVTEKFTRHFMRLIEEVDERIPNNVYLDFHFKPTLTSEIIRKLQTEEAVIKYYKFFELFYSAARLKIKNPVKSQISPTIPNTATPSPHTVEDGKLFANFCRICREITNKNRRNRIFKFYSDIVPFAPRTKINYDRLDYTTNCSHCGSGHSVIGLLPDDMISVCHNGFCDLITDYKKYSNSVGQEDKAIDFRLFMMNNSNVLIYDEESFGKYERMVKEYTTTDSKFKLVNMASEIRLLAFNKQVDTKYKDPTEALKAARFIEMSTSYCIRDNVGVTGSAGLVPLGMFKLLLNGAREYIENV